MRQKSFTSSFSQATFARLGERIRRARKARGITLQQMEARCGVHRSTLARLEAGDMGVSFAVLAAVLEALDKLSEIEAVLSHPEALGPRAPDIPQLDTNF